MKKKLIILGCGSSIGVPRIDGFWGKCKKNEKKNIRTRCSALIIKGSNIVLIDTSPDIRHQLLSNKIRNISSVIFTHEHADQTNGLFELRPFFWKNKKKIEAYGSSSTMMLIKKRQEFLFKKTSAYEPIIQSKNIKSIISFGKDREKLTIKSLKASHGSITSLIFVFEKTAYISDCNDLKVIKMKDLKNLNYLVIDCLRLSKHPSHFNLDECIFIHRYLKPKKTILTNLHYSLDYNYLLKNLPMNMEPAYDGLNINL